jgi:hypothetical protein
MALPRFGSIPDHGTTEVNEVVTDLARLANMSTVPRLVEPIEWADLDATQSWMVDVVKLGMCVQAILDMSPVGDEETLRVLAALVGKGVVTCRPHA